MTERSRIFERETANERRNDPAAATPCECPSRCEVEKHLFNCYQCVVGDSSTIQHGNPYLKKWMGWLEENADVRFAGES
jgi:hypothetical protein